MDYGKSGRELLLELQRARQKMTATSAATTTNNSSSATQSLLPAYNERLVQACLSDFQLHFEALRNQIEANAVSSSNSNDATTNSSARKLPTAVRPSVLLQKAAMARNKRCLLAYHHTRLEIWKDSYYWQSAELEDRTAGAAAAAVSTTTTTADRLSPAESKFTQRYHQLVQSYTKRCSALWDGNSDLRSHLLKCPLHNQDRVQVRMTLCTEEELEGPIVLESGMTIHFQPGAIYHLLYADVESMIRRGILQVVAGEEEYQE